MKKPTQVDPSIERNRLVLHNPIICNQQQNSVDVDAVQVKYKKEKKLKSHPFLRLNIFLGNNFDYLPFKEHEPQAGNDVAQ